MTTLRGATGLGSLPGTDAAEAARLVVGELPDLPHLAELSAVRRHVYARLDTLPELIHYVPTRGAFYVLIRMPAVADPLAFNQAMIERFRVATIPGFAFGIDPAQGNWQRLSYGALARDDVTEGVDRFVEAVRTLYR